MDEVSEWKLILTVELGWPGEDLIANAMVPSPEHLGRRMASSLGIPTKVTRASDENHAPSRPNRYFKVETKGKTTVGAVRDAACTALSFHDTGGMVGLEILVTVQATDGIEEARGVGHPFPR